MNRLPLLLLALSLLSLSACKKNEPQPVTHNEEPYVPLNQMDSAAGYPPAFTATGAPGMGADQTTFNAGEPAASSDEVLTPAGSSTGGAGDVHVVRQGDTLYSLARRYYNDQAKWRDIWNANRAQVGNPDQIKVGMKLVMP